jgi:hypothetical protein
VSDTILSEPAPPDEAGNDEEFKGWVGWNPARRIPGHASFPLPADRISSPENKRFTEGPQ